LVKIACTDMTRDAQAMVVIDTHCNMCGRDEVFYIGLRGASQGLVQKKNLTK